MQVNFLISAMASFPATTVHCTRPWRFLFYVVVILCVKFVEAHWAERTGLTPMPIPPAFWKVNLIVCNRKPSCHPQAVGYHTLV